MILLAVAVNRLLNAVDRAVAAVKADEDDHFYGAWSGGSVAEGGRPARSARMPAAQEASVSSWEQRIAAEERARNPNPGYGGSYGPERGLLVDQYGNTIWQGTGERTHIGSDVQDLFAPGFVFTHFHPDESDRAHMSVADVNAALRTGASVRAFNPNGAWESFTPAGVNAHKLGIGSQDLYVHAKSVAAERGLGLQDAMSAVIRDLTTSYGTWAEGTGT